MSEQATQAAFEFLSDIPEVEVKAKPSRWYYVTRRRNSEMLHYVADYGTPVWAEHDTRNVLPHLFSSAAKAKKAMRKHGGNETKRFYFRPENRRR